MYQLKTGKYRSLFVSDLHLGTRGSQADLFLDFLRRVDAETIYLVGDIVDFWRLRSRLFGKWRSEHRDVVRRLVERARSGARVVFIPGNHDADARRYVGRTIAGVEVMRDAIHVGADGRRYLVTHGDEFDVVNERATWLAHMGDYGYALALFGNTYLAAARRWLGLRYWSFSNWVKHKVKEAVNFIGAYEDALVAAARARGADAVICGHIHHPAMRDIDGIGYLNIGDFVESCTALVEHHDGRMELLHWGGAPEAVAATEEPELAAQAA
ncbi:MAG: UDP-2,3-diacylglucosamine diphosphatase [Hyphomicrobiales bacterium]|nr:UDP-2,3-diacylglucosamine diphosphatase [Hyphomicrobiales bacterium]MDE2016978.1 UDP-2,3-diacylglucosamine diphosphatase [Hyphomicrobiales bacterium]